jgi:predicted NAD/FAD-binding protein
MRIAIVGAGVSGLVAAHLLYPQHDVTVYEAASYAGGHAHTVSVHDAAGTQHVDTGFIAFNDRNYPNLTRLLQNLGVAVQGTHMSFSVKGEEQDFEYCGTPRGVFCQRRNLLRPWFWRMFAELPRFNRELRLLLPHERAGEPHARRAHPAAHTSRWESARGQSLEDFLAERRFSEDFVQRLIVPQISAVWSADPRQLQSFPVAFLAEFLDNHGMLGFRDRPRWFTVTGGSARYVEALTGPFRHRIQLNTPVHSVTRKPDHVELRIPRRASPRQGSAGDGSEGERIGEWTGEWATELYDHVIIATHSDQALALLADPSDQELDVLGAIPYQSNEVVLHTDSSLLPRRRAARAAWNFHLTATPPPHTTVTYDMNHLQRLRCKSHYCVTLNRSDAIDPASILQRLTYSHPIYTPCGVAAQSRHAAISSVEGRTHYCGAYWGWGFHEDGVVSALRACAPFGVAL